MSKQDIVHSEPFILASGSKIRKKILSDHGINFDVQKSEIDEEELKKNILETTAEFIACGLDFKKSIIFNQSSVSAHAELAWIFNCISRIGWMNRMTQFKEKAGSDKENASVGLYVYPSLMAADILLYKATHVPVGDDQKQHLELVRNVAQKFNNDFKSSNFFQFQNL